MGRSQLVIDYKLLQSEIDKLESDSSYVNYTELCNAVNIYDVSLQPNGCVSTEKHRRLPIHPQQVYKAITSNKVICKTIPGKRGRSTGVPINRTTKADKFSSNPDIVLALDKLELDVPESYKAVFERAKRGSVKAFIILKCANCYGWSKAYKSCNCSMCPLFALNLSMFPKRHKSEDYEYDPMDKVLK